MDAKILAAVGKVAGLGGLALGVLLLIFKNILTESVLSGLEKNQQFALIMAMMVLTFGIAGVGIIGWLLSKAVSPTHQVTIPQLVFLSSLIVAVLGFAAYTGTAPPQPKPPPQRVFFVDEVNLDANGSARTPHGVLVETGPMHAPSMNGRSRENFVWVGAGIGIVKHEQNMRSGDSFRISDPDCDDLQVAARSVALLDGATFLVTGKCAPLR